MHQGILYCYFFVDVKTIKLVWSQDMREILYEDIIEVFVVEASNSYTPNNKSSKA